MGELEYFTKYSANIIAKIITRFANCIIYLTRDFRIVKHIKYMINADFFLFLLSMYS